ncbi:UDP-N-acetylglucosamine transferase subunit ALG14 [Cladorrhinum samala]|uniref:UDP-N-acetylglucosamine transferase subunit ALG14 n=1 Tax=Cladorrhinum samala TaxID=585594 RepID=A0AAV9HFY1_9PEZI|nr:UDP-N-acetylglucosamine transferase subunit ALG14 [Cladorrhinum samala]
MPEDVSVTMDPQKRISRGEGSELRIEIEKLDDESTTNESLQTVKFAVAPKVRPTLDEKQQQKQQEQDEIKTMDDLGKAPLPHGSHVFALVGLFFLAVPLWLSVVCSWVWLVLLGALLPTFVVFRHFFVKRNTAPTPGRMWATTLWGEGEEPVPDTAGLPAVYFLFVLGSGGHTAEMMEIIKKQFQGRPNQHRRYVVTSGDTSWFNAMSLEHTIFMTYHDGNGGTCDLFTIPRARKVHQSLLTSPFTCLWTAIKAFYALTLHPADRPAERYGDSYKWPHVIVTNGPATGFIVCLVAHLLKMFYLAPPNCLKMVYIESWARTRSLSLTGKLFKWTGIADMLCVQHKGLATKTGAEYIGLVKTKNVPFG